MVTTKQDFYARAERVGECLLYAGRGRVGPYGSVGYEGGSWLAHRLSYHLTHGDLPEVVRHSCDTPLCIEPAHLLAGTHADNVADKVARGRQLFGERHPMAALSAETVRAIRERVAAGERQKDVADDLGQTKQNVSRIVRGQRWALVGAA